jgi:hypothetical protein
MRLALYFAVVYAIMFGMFFTWPKWWKGDFVTWNGLSRTKKGRAALQEMIAATNLEMTEEEALMGLRFAAAVWWPRVLLSGISHRMRLRIRAAHVAELRRKRRERKETE